jgi:hypothetical protein
MATRSFHGLTSPACILGQLSVLLTSQPDIPKLLSVRCFSGHQRACHFTSVDGGHEMFLSVSARGRHSEVGAPLWCGFGQDADRRESRLAHGVLHSCRLTPSAMLLGRMLRARDAPIADSPTLDRIAKFTVTQDRLLRIGASDD